jgi:hypothetical protein
LFKKLAVNSSKDEATIETSQLFSISKTRSAAASRVNNKQEIEDYILTFKTSSYFFNINQANA